MRIRVDLSGLRSVPALVRANDVRAVSWLLILAGGFLVYQGASFYFAQHAGQEEARGEWEQSTHSSVEPAPAMPKGVVARLSFPKLDQDLFVLDNTRDATLKKGPGLVEYTALPGMPGNSAIAGHRDTHFRFLKDVTIGDDIWVEGAAGRTRYKVTWTRIVRPTDVAVLSPETKPVLTLITCYPFFWVGNAPKRYIVRAEKVDTVPTLSEAVSTGGQ